MCWSSRRSMSPSSESKTGDDSGTRTKPCSGRPSQRNFTWSSSHGSYILPLIARHTNRSRRVESFIPGVVPK